MPAHATQAKLAKRTAKSQVALRDALLRLLETQELGTVTVSQLAREANVSRGTFYAHYKNVSEVYLELLEQLAHKTAALLPQTGLGAEDDRCQLCQSAGRHPFCQIARHDSEGYGALIRQDRFLGDMIDNAGVPQGNDLEAYLMEHGHGWQQARVIRMFQMAGCYMVATRSHVSESDWPHTKELVDRFIAGGIEALVSGDDH